MLALLKILNNKKGITPPTTTFAMYFNFCVTMTYKIPRYEIILIFLKTSLKISNAITDDDNDDINDD